MKIDNQIAKKLKEDFAIFKHNLGLVYLDNAATSQRPISVIKTTQNFIERDNANVGRGVYTLAERAMKRYDQAREFVASFIAADSDEIVFTKNITESINLLSHSLQSMIPKGKDEILLTEMEHHSNIVPWQQFAKRNKMKILYVDIDKDFNLDMKSLKSKLTNKTAIFSFAYASNVLGTINPVKEMVKLAKGKGAITVIDAAQAIQHIPINVKDLDCDFLAFSGHKVLGPTGIGVLYGKKDLLEKMEPFHFGGGMIESVDWEESKWQKAPEKFEAGTQNVSEAIGLAESLSYIKKIGIEDIAKWEEKLKDYALKRLKEVKNIKIYHSMKKSVPVIAFTLGSIHPHDVAELLNEKKIAIRAGHMCAMPLMSVLGVKGGVCRASLSFYNTLEDIDLLVDSLKEIQARFA